MNEEVFPLIYFKSQLDHLELVREAIEKNTEIKTILELITKENVTNWGEETWSAQNKVCDALFQGGFGNDRYNRKKNNNNFNIFETLAKNGYYWDDKHPPLAIENAELDIFKYMHEHKDIGSSSGAVGRFMIDGDDLSGRIITIWTSESLELFKYLIENEYELYVNDIDYSNFAPESGNIYFLKLLFENVYKFDETTGYKASENGHLECLQYLGSKNCKMNKFTFTYALFGEHLECLKYLIEIESIPPNELFNLIVSVRYTPKSPDDPGWSVKPEFKLKVLPLLEAYAKNMTQIGLYEQPKCDDECPCCLEEFTSERAYGKLACGHCMHVECLLKWKLNDDPTCPMCRKGINVRYDKNQKKKIIFNGGTRSKPTIKPNVKTPTIKPNVKTPTIKPNVKNTVSNLSLIQLKEKVDFLNLDKKLKRLNKNELRDAIYSQVIKASHRKSR
jgi:hypothetical protein